MFVSGALNPRLLRILLSAFAALSLRAAADEWVSEEYRCALTLPTQEPWAPALRQPLPFGEMIFHSVSMASNRGIMITFVSAMPSSDIRNPAVVKRVTELLESQGWSVDEPTRLVWKERPFLQFIGYRRDVVAGKLVGVSRVTPRGQSLYIITAYGKGEADRAESADFMGVMETFRLIDQAVIPGNRTDGPSARMIRLAMLGSAGAAAVLVVAYGLVVFFSHRRRQTELEQNP